MRVTIADAATRRRRRCWPTQTILRKRVAWIDAQPPFVIEEIVYLQSGWVDSPDDRPVTS